ncbi:FUSC family protein [Williamsia sp. 1138]|uniref:FUSC family protein n=1 Tax=Williamsia sp. 1138 TaxID=1903117 RepID=UPI00143DF942|nr:FUSC family protein [Williamsia sp. 1138]
MIALYLSPWSSNTALVYLGLLPAVVALESGVRVAAVTAILTPVSVLVGLLVGGSAWSAAVYIAALCLAVAWSYTRGWEGPATYVASQAALAAIAVPGTTLVDGAPNSPTSALVVAAFVLLGGLWVAFIGSFFLDDLPHRDRETPTRRDLYRFALTLTALAFVGTLAAKLVLPGGHAWWVLLTIFVVLQPGIAGSTTRTLHRVLGTVGGGLVAAVLVNLIGINTLTTAIGVIIAVLSGIAYLKAPYWAFAALLTAALMCLSFTPETVMYGYAERAGFTLLGALAVAVVLSVTDLILKQTSKAHPQPTKSSEQND